MCWNFLKKLFGIKPKPQTEEKDPEIVVVGGEIDDNYQPVIELVGDKTQIEDDTVPVVIKTPEEIELDEKETQLLSCSQSDLVVLIDNGHAKSTPGKFSPLFPDGTRFYEWEFNRIIADKLVALLEKEGIKYEIITPEDNYDVKLTVRANRANNYCKKYGTSNCLFISIHGNAFGNGTKWETPGGWSVWTSRGETKADPIAKLFYEEAAKILPQYGFNVRDGKVQGNGNAGPDYEDNFTVLTKTICPAILTENLFYTNRKEVDWMMSEEGQDAIALIHFNGIKRVIEERKG